MTTSLEPTSKVIMIYRPEENSSHNATIQFERIDYLTLSSDGSMTLDELDSGRDLFAGENLFWFDLTASDEPIKIETDRQLNAALNILSAAIISHQGNVSKRLNFFLTDKKRILEALPERYKGESS